VSRRELGVLLRGLRTERGWTVQQVAARLGFSQSKVSRLETGQRGASARDVRDLCDLYQVDDELRQRLADLAAEGKQRTVWQPLGLSYTNYQELESAAVSIQDYALGIMPGLLQTADYARGIVQATSREDDWTSDEVELRVTHRMIRQRLLQRENAPYYEAVIDEAVLHRVVGSPATMRGQLQRLLDASHLRTVEVRVIRFDSGPLPAGNNKFIILRFATPELPAVVFIEGLTGDLYLDRRQDVKVYAQTFAALTQMALTPDETRDRIAAMIHSYDAQRG
jgi:transcriptional regulator with XRE-family HTH domain